MSMRRSLKAFIRKSLINEDHTAVPPLHFISLRNGVRKIVFAYNYCNPLKSVFYPQKLLTIFKFYFCVCLLEILILFLRNYLHSCLCLF